MVPVAVLALAGCGGSRDVPDERPSPDRRVAVGELRSPDARSPFVTAGGGAWRCPTGGQIVLAVSAEGMATLSIEGSLLASVAPSRALVNRRCERSPVARARARAPAGMLGGRLGATVVRCRAPGAVVVDFHGVDVSVRSQGGARFLARAAVRADGIGVAGYWGEGCVPA